MLDKYLIDHFTFCLANIQPTGLAADSLAAHAKGQHFTNQGMGMKNRFGRTGIGTNKCGQ